jgi:hypothetical protein
MPDRFSLGQTVIPGHARDALNPEDVVVGLGRHARCDWGELDDEDKGLNDRAVEDGDRLLSAYCDRNHVKFWIITEADRSVTTVLLPEDY